MALFCTFLTTAWPEPCAVRSIRGEPASAGNRQSFASSIYLTFPQDLHDPQIRRVGFRVSKTTHAACRLSAWAVRGPAYHSELPKTLCTVPTDSVYHRIARLLRVVVERYPKARIGSAGGVRRRQVHRCRSCRQTVCIISRAPPDDRGCTPRLPRRNSSVSLHHPLREAGLSAHGETARPQAVDRSGACPVSLLTTAWPEPCAVRSIRGKPASAREPSIFRQLHRSDFPRDLHDPRIRRVGFRVSKTTHAACRLSAWAVCGPAYHSREQPVHPAAQVSIP